jgi:hypothetical protein
MRARVDTTQRKKDGSKQSTKNKKKLYANKTQSYKMMINDNKDNLRQKNSHLP